MPKPKKTEAKPSETPEKTEDLILVRVKHPGFGPHGAASRRRAGHRFEGAKLYKPGDFTDEQWEVIKADPYLFVQDPYDPDAVKEGAKPSKAFEESVARADEERMARKRGERAWDPTDIPKPPAPPQATTTARPPRENKGMVAKVRADHERWMAEQEASRKDPETIDPRPPAK